MKKFDVMAYLNRRQKLHRVAGIAFIASIVMLYLGSLAVRVLILPASIGELLWDFLMPLPILCSFYFSKQWKQLSAKFFQQMLPTMPLAAVVIGVLAFLMASMVRDPFQISLLAAIGMAVTVTAIHIHSAQAGVLIVAEAMAFMLLAAKTETAAAIVSIAIVAATLLLVLPKLNYMGARRKSKANRVLCLALLVLGTLTLVVQTETGILKAFVVSAMGRPGFGSSASVNAACRTILENAKLIGGIDIGYADHLLAHRELTLLLEKAGWIAAMAIQGALATMIVSGIYLLWRCYRYKFYCGAAAMAMLALQSLGYCLMCGGWDKLLFAEFMPFGGSFGQNTLCLLMAAVILPSWQSFKGRSFTYPEEEEPDTAEEPEEEE